MSKESPWKYFQKDKYIVNAPIVSINQFSGPVKVTYKSSKSHRVAVYKIMRNLCHEKGYSSFLYGTDGLENDPYCNSYLMFDKRKQISYYNKTKLPVLGVACFRQHAFTLKDESQQVLRILTWVWTHPFFRGCNPVDDPMESKKEGLLSSYWNELLKLEGEFMVEKPISLEMQGFLQKRGFNTEDNRAYAFPESCREVAENMKLIDRFLGRA